MASRSSEEIVYIHSEDGFRLEGAVIRPAGGPAHPRPVIWVHGLTGKFYEPMTIAIGRLLAGRGHLFVTGNNRGHDFGAVLRTEDGRRLIGGGAWELFEQSPCDISAWVDFAAALSAGLPAGREGAGEVVLLGHSLGSLKVPYYQAARRDPRVKAIISASPPLRAGRASAEMKALVQRMAAEDRGRDLLPWDFMDAGGGTLSAQTALGWAAIDVYGEHTPNPAISRIDRPILAFYGTEESRVGTAADLETIRRNAASAPRVDTAMIEGADHHYKGRERETATLIADWVESLA